MRRIDRLYIDANIFVRLFESTDALSASLTDLLFAGGGPSEPRLVTSELTLAELLVAPYRDKDDRLIEVYDGWVASGPFLEVAPVNRGVLYYAAVMRAQYRTLKLPDAIHLSTAIGLRCGHFLTGDKRLSDRYEVTHERHGRATGPVIIEILRPQLEVVKEITEALNAR